MAQQPLQQLTKKRAQIPSGPADFLVSRPRKADGTSEAWIGWNLIIAEQDEVTGAE